jgi:beta-galactosidase
VRFVVTGIASLVAVATSWVRAEGLSGRADTSVHAETSARGTSSGRLVAPLDSGWRFVRSDVNGAERSDFDDSAWERVDLPHSYNAKDGDVGGAYYRGPAWYRRAVDQPRLRPNRRTYLQFDGAALVADVWVNGNRAGRHEGGYAAFRLDVTDLLHAGRNVLAVRVDNSKVPGVAPLGGDFTVFGGLYRNVYLVTTDDLHIDTLDYGGPGVYVSASDVSAERANLTVMTRVRNDRTRAASAEVRTAVLDARGDRVTLLSSRVDVAAGAVVPVTQRRIIERPRLWDGRRDPYLYHVTTEIVDSGRRTNSGALDAVTVSLGFRSFQIDASAGSILNGHQLALHGVDLFHAGRPGRGLAVTDAEIDEDVRIVADVGATGVRLVHFQHPQRTYDDADRVGLVVWTEIPLNSAIDTNAAFESNIAAQMRELIRQNYNHPSVVTWGLGNELYASNSDTNRVLAAVQAVAAQDDPSRPTTYAHCCLSDTDPNASHSDVIAYNRYFGWYSDAVDKLGAWADALHARIPQRAFAVSEYGAGASVLQQEDPPSRPVPNSQWHPEQYQALYHETSWRQLRDRPYLWASFVWVAFDLASNGRNEGGRPGINDKGLVSYDRATKKDAYYWYQANWTDAPMVYITSRRFAQRSTSNVDVKVYTNTESVTLSVNGTSLGMQTPSDHIAVWKSVRLANGSNHIEVAGTRGESICHDAVTWTR